MKSMCTDKLVSFYLLSFNFHLFIQVLDYILSVEMVCLLGIQNEIQAVCFAISTVVIVEETPSKIIPRAL